MNHRNGFNPLSRTTAHRRAMTRNMVTSLFRYERITTTEAKAKEVRKAAEKLITRAKVDSVHNRRTVAKFIADEKILNKLFTEIGPRMKERNGGYTRILKLGFRQGDAADTVIFELVDYKLPDSSAEEEKAAKKAAKKAKKNHEADKPDTENDDSDSVSSKIVMVLVTILIIAIWLGIFAVFVKADVGGFGSTVLAPALKDVPVLSKILPDSGNITASESTETAGYTNLDDAVSRIKELEKQLDDANSKNQADAQTINDLNAQIQDLSTYKDDQAAFEEEKEKYYEEVVFSDKAPDIKEYKKFYEQIDPANAEILYKQVCEQLEQDDEIKDYAQTYSKMKPKEAAAIFDSMTDNLSLVAKILNAMDAQSRGNILGKMDSATAAKVTKIMNPSQN